MKGKFFMVAIVLGVLFFSAFTPPAKGKKVKWAKILLGREYVQQLNPKADPRFGYYDYVYFDAEGVLLMKKGQTLYNCNYVVNDNVTASCTCTDTKEVKMFQLYHLDTLIDEKGIKWIYKPDEAEEETHK